LPDAASLLTGVADALAACERAGMGVCLTGDAVISDHGFVFRMSSGWTARTRTRPPFTLTGDGDDDG